MNKQAIILAAGRGSRMGDATASKPKCLNVLAGKTLLEWQLNALHEAGIAQIMVVTGYRSEMLRGNFTTVKNDRWSETNMVASLFYAPAFEGDTVISYSDIAYHPAHVEQLMGTEGDIVITADLLWEELWNKRMDDPLSDAETFKTREGQLYEIGKQPSSVDEVEAQYMGLLKISAAGRQKMHELFSGLTREQQDKMDMTSMLNKLLERGDRIDVAFVEGKWCEADSYSDIMAYEREIATDKNWRHDWR